MHPLSEGIRALPVLAAEDVAMTYKIKSGRLRALRVEAVRGVSLELPRGETFGLLGESGSGKSTLGRMLMMLERPDRGRVLYQGHDAEGLSSADRRSLRRKLQIVWQDPFSSFDPSVPLRHSLREPLQVHESLTKAEMDMRIHEVVAAVGLDERHLLQHPRQLSGGQLQRLAIARALTVDPEVVLLDEPVSALDMSTQAQIINLLMDLQEERGLTFLFISHNPAVVQHISHRIGVMYKGQLVEVGDADQVRNQPAHEYTRKLQSAELSGDPRAPRLRTVAGGG